MNKALWAGGLIMALAVTACSATSPQGPAASPAAAASPTSVAPSAAQAGRATAPAAARPASPTVASHIGVTRVRTADGSVITVAVFRGPVRYVLHDGSWDPYSKYSRLAQAGRKVTAAERPRLEAAFNGGFLMRSLAGGYEQEGHVFRKLQYGLASLVIDRSGRARIAVGDVTAPDRGEAVYSVRQNLWPLVLNGQITAEAALWWRWGSTKLVRRTRPSQRARPERRRGPDVRGERVGHP